METNKCVQKPCIGCKYYKECGSTTRTEYCAGRELKGRKHKYSGLRMYNHNSKGI